MDHIYDTLFPLGTASEVSYVVSRSMAIGFAGLEKIVNNV